MSGAVLLVVSVFLIACAILLFGYATLRLTRSRLLHRRVFGSAIRRGARTEPRPGEDWSPYRAPALSRYPLPAAPCRTCGHHHRPSLPGCPTHHGEA